MRMEEEIEVSLAGGIACPYTASWLAHTSLVQEAHWVHSLKMEEASFSILRKASHIFQIVDDQSYYVNHLSGYEHEVMNFQNYSFAEEKTHQLSLKAASKECESIDQYKFFNHTLSIIPFYGGRPPMVSEDLRVHSIGQGNSLVNSTTKSLQCIATACSTLRYFASSIIAVATISDKRIVEQMIANYLPLLSSTRIHVIQFHAHPPALLPIHLLLWVQTCSGKQSACTNNQSPDCVEMRRLCAVYRNIVDKRGPISRIYYTESDQIVRIEERYVEPLLRASNRSTIFMGHRKQKDPQTDPQLHMEGLKQTRATCGRRGFFLSAKDFQVRDSLNLPVENTSIASHESSPLAPNMKLRGAIMWKKQQAEAISLMKQSFRESE